MSRLSLGAALLLLTLMAWGTPSASRVQLANGLQIIVERTPNAPLTALEVWVRTGVAHETPDTSGVAHLLEHLLFRGAVGLPPDALDSAFENVGGVLDAFTERDWTRFRASLLPNQWREPLQTLLRSLLAPALPAHALGKERQIILRDEYATHHADPVRLARYALFAEMFPQHPYGLPLLGNPNTLAQISIETIHQFHRDHYRPDQMIIVVVGAVEPNAVREAVEEVLARLPDSMPQSRSKPAVSSPVPMQGIYAVNAGRDVLALGLLVPPAQDIDGWLCAEVLRVAIAEPYRGLLYAGEPPFGRLQSEFLPRLQGSVLVFYALPPLAGGDDWQAQTRQRLLDALQQIAAGERRTALEEARQTVLARHTTQMRHLSERARWHGLCAALNLPLTPEAFTNRLRTLPVETVEKFVARLLGGTEPPAPTATSQEAAPPASLPSLPNTAARSIARQRLANGVRVLALNAPDADSVVIQVAIGHPTGASPAAGELTLRMLFGATQNETERTLAVRIARSGGTLRIEWTPAGTLITAYARPDSVVNVLSLLKEALFRAEFSEDALQRTRQHALYDRRYREGGQAWRLTAHLTVGYADEAVLERVRLSEIRAYYRAHYRPQNTVIALAGNFPVERLTEFVRLMFGSAWEGEARAPTPVPTHIPHKQRVATVAAPHGLHYTGYGWTAPIVRAEDYYALKAWQFVLGEGKRARLFVSAREHQGIGYDIRAETWLLGGTVAGVGWLQTGSTPAPQQVLQEALSAQLTEAEFQRTCALLLSEWERLRLNLPALTAALAWAELSGLGYETVWNAPVYIQQLTREAVEQVRKQLVGSVFENSLFLIPPLLAGEVTPNPLRMRGGIENAPIAYTPCDFPNARNCGCK